ncbi:MAG: biotin--[acetyl-CoA-carboxylase] ligase [Clostridia bacterium]|nr:biotin--[acetyl-CoA-carboxylase] ligase [Clostridia bacterium]
MNTINGYRVERFDELPSTNDYIKEKRSEKQNVIITAKRQTRGRGTKGRSFVSETGGVYVSVLTFYPSLLAKDAFSIMANSAVAVCETLSAYGVRPVIKWPNDIHVHGKKICGILIENAFSGAYVSSSVVGVGLNVANAVPETLSAIAITLAQATGRSFSDVEIAEVEERLLFALTFRRENVLQEYRKYLGYIGQTATILVGEEKLPVRLRGVDSTGRLIAETEQGEQSFSSAEVSLRT